MLNIFNNPEEILSVIQNAESQMEKTGKCFLEEGELRSLKRRLSRLLKKVDNEKDSKS